MTGILARVRQCGDCTLCCTLLPVVPLGKKASERCEHQRFKKGCAVYRTLGMPMECSVWSCRWIVNDDMTDQSRPDRSHLVVDIMPDFVTVVDNETGDTMKVQVTQVWCDQKHREAHRDPLFRRYLERLGRKGIAAIIRFNSKDCVTIFPPSMSSDHQWHEIVGDAEHEHTPAERAEFLSDAHLVFTEDPNVG